MERQYVIENRKERERLKKLVNSLTDEELNLLIYKEGWTIATALGHLAFWDQIALGVLRKWRENGVTPEPSMDVDILNDALLRLFLALPPRMIVELAVTFAEAADRAAAQSTTEFIRAIESSKEPPYRLNRGFHRKMHLDEIEALLKAKRGNAIS
jgi:hypothetical protein